MPKRILIGTVVSDKTDKTVVVKVERKVKHPLYGKIIRRSKKYHAHDEANAFKTGETVRIEETSPYSSSRPGRLSTGFWLGRPPRSKRTFDKTSVLGLRERHVFGTAGLVPASQ
jgi:small subunit ribosomal protein S17